MKKLTAVLFAAAFTFAAAMPVYAEDAEISADFYTEDTFDNGNAYTPVHSQATSKPEAPVQAVNDKAVKKNAAAVKSQAKEIVDKAKADKKRVDSEARDIKTKAKNDEKLVSDKTKNMKDKANAEKSQLDNEAKTLEEKAKAIKDKAKAQHKDAMHEINVLTQNAKSAKDSEFRRADSMSNAAAEKLAEAERQANLLLKSIE